MGHAILRDLSPEAFTGEGVSMYDAYQRAWQSALAWERGRQKVLTDRWMVRNPKCLFEVCYASEEDAEADAESWGDGTEVIRVKIVEAE